MTNTIELPKEIWLEVMSYLNYSDLKKCMHVSKEFKSFTELPVCQETMFRSSKKLIPDGGAIDPDNIQLHPAFDYMNYGCTGKLEDVKFYTGDGYNDTVALTDTCAAEEYATDPPVALIRLQIHGWPVVQVTNKSGVTVHQVTKALCGFFSDDDSRRERMGDHFVWNGWDFKRLDRRGCLLLRAMFFDS